MNFVVDEDSVEDAFEKLDLIIVELQEENAQLRDENRNLKEKLFRFFQLLHDLLSSPF